MDTAAQMQWQRRVTTRAMGRCAWMCCRAYVLAFCMTFVGEERCSLTTLGKVLLLKETL